VAVRTFMNAARASSPGADECSVAGCDTVPGPAGDHQHRGPLPLTFDELTDLFLQQAVAVLSGPTGLAAHLRTTAGGPAACGVSLPLDVGAVTATIPPHLRRAVITRDRHCAWPGCHQRPAACQVHHVIPRSQGGTTSLTNLVLLCPFHHLIMIHRQGWALALNADGTTTVTSPDGQRTWHSHSPPTLATVL
jgi:HNH endonuclease